MRKIFHKLYVKVYLCFLFIIMVFVGLMGTIFNQLFSKSTMSSYYKVLSSQVEVIAERMGRYVLSNDLEDYGVYMATLQDTVTADVWILSNPTAYTPMNPELENIKLNDEELTKENRQVLYEAFQGKIESVTAYNEMYGSNTMTIGAPIYNEKEEVVGAVLLLAPIEMEQQTMNHTYMLLFISVLIAAGISVILAFVLTKKLTKPISKIRATTKLIAEGNYRVKTGIRENNEIGELASMVDVLSEKLEKSENERENMEKMRKDFFSNVSHELRTPITVIRAYLESLVDNVVPQDKHQQYYERMLAECTGMQRLVQDLLLLSKMENPDFIIEKEPINLVQIFDDVIRSMRVVCKNKNLTLHFESDKECCFILGDYDRIRQVFIAILDNAIKFSYLGGNIYIKIDSKDNIIVTVKDEGDGITPEELPHVFEKFYTKKQSNNPNGSGLGLVIAKQIVEKHGGTIKVESQKGDGTVFTFAFQQIFLNEDGNCM